MEAEVIKECLECCREYPVYPILVKGQKERYKFGDLLDLLEEDAEETHHHLFVLLKGDYFESLVDFSILDDVGVVSETVEAVE